MKSEGFKTIAELEQEKNTFRKRYYNKYHYIQSCALTTFLKQLEAQYGERFKLLSANPHIAIYRDAEDDMDATARFCIDEYANWMIDNVAFYLELPENIYSPVRFTKDSEYIDTPLSVSLYKNINVFECDKQTCDIIVKNMHEVLKHVTTRNVPMQASDRKPCAGAYCDFGPKSYQTIYKL